MNKLAKIGAAFFILWGLVHILGGASILGALGESADQGFATYRNSSSGYDPLAGSILGYFCFLLIGIGVTASTIGWCMNRHNSQAGLAMNTAMIAFTEVGLLWFLVLPGYVPWAEASVGLVPFALAAITSGVACQAAHGEQPA